MKKIKPHVGVLVALLILSTGFKKNSEPQNIPAEKSYVTNNLIAIFSEPVKVSIAGTSVIKSDKGQKPVKVMVYLSKAATEPVSVKYKTIDGSAKAGADYVASNGSLTFQPGEVVKWITVQIIGQAAADPDDDAAVNFVPDFIIEISQSVGVIIDMARALISILPYIPANLGGNDAVYEVIISYTGYTTFSGTFDECGVRPDGIVVLSGYLSGRENVGADDDINYSGNLEMIIDIDICSVHRKANGEDDYCGIRVAGSGTVFTELQIIFGTDMSGNYDGRGGYIKIENKDGKFRRVVTGSCADGQVDEEWTMVPNKSISSIFNGMELPMLTDRTLRKRIYPAQRTDAGEVVVEVLRKIR
jgi:Calx-beta domain